MKERDLYLLGTAALLAGGLWYVYSEEGGGASLPFIGPFIGSLKEQRLEPITQQKWFQLKQVLLEKHDIEALAATTLRSEAAQQKALADGKSDVTVSWHFSGRAVDAWLRRPGEAWDSGARQLELYRTMHREWAALGGEGDAFRPYPEGPKHYLKNGVWDAGHIFWRGPYANATEAYQDYIA